MSQTCYLVLDQGGQSSRALVISSAGDILASAAMTVTTQMLPDNRVEQDPLALVESLQSVADQAISKLSSEQRKNLLAAALVTQRSSLLCWQTDTREALTPVISWQDQRAHAWLAHLKIDPHWFRHRTGLYPNAHYGASKMHWCLNNQPEVQQAFIDKKLTCGPLASYLTARLTRCSKVFIDPANAQRTALYNIERGEWDKDLLQLFDIPVTVLPELVTTVGAFGILDVGGKQLPLKLLNGDQSTAIFAHGQPRIGTAYVNAGTGAFILAPWSSDSYPEPLLKSVIFKNDKTSYVVEGTVNGAGSALNWAQQQLHLAEINELDHWAKACTDVPLFINAIGGLGSPYWRADVTSGFVGEENLRACSDQQKMVAVLESIVFLLQSNLALMQAHGLTLERIIISGGLSQLNNFCQKLADLSRIPVWRPYNVEATARGAAFLLAQHHKSAPSDPLSWHTLAGTDFTPGSSAQGMLSQRFGRWRQVLQTRL